MRPKDEWKKRWRSKLLELGMDALAIMQQPRELRENKAEMILNLPAKIDALIDRMYDDLSEPKIAGKVS